MSSTPDALLSLQRTIKSKSSITFIDAASISTASLQAAAEIQLLHGAFRKSAPTRLRKPNATSTNPADDPDGFFSLSAVYLAWTNRDANVAEYLRQVRENGLGAGAFVSVTERKDVADWLEGKTSHLDNIVPLASGSTTPPGSPPQSVLALHKASSVLPSSSSSRLHDLTSSTQTPTKRRYVADTADIEVVKRIKTQEIELRDRNSVLRGIKQNNFSNVRTAFTEKLKKMKEAGKSGIPASVSMPDPKLQARKAKNQFPIIMISSSPTALITMHNVKSFLQDSTYMPSQDARAQAAAEGNARPEDLIAIYRKRTGVDSAGRETESHARYFVVDSTEALSKFGTDAWDRVVCVMTTGQAWQFKPYKWNDPKVLFHHVKGIYVSLTSDPPNTKIKDWNVTELKIDPHRRHVDRAVVAHFWKLLDTWTMANKPWLLKV
ncbi:RNA polymerase II-associated protein [Cristinia sonorae]|uniref:RNA polymerase II-associated protein n=1 Tax=Cristinia sonorae TaxID=1940300 RepID=A0A8K0XPP0_9AGAR|nr:RNA polymerase II-associated protein [Cristinia sonorae]